MFRAATATAHRTLEQKLEIARTDADDATYTRYLAAVIGWLEPLESPLWSGGWPAAVTPTARSGKVAWIEADLRARGMNERDIAALPRQTKLPALDSLAHRFGVAYVVEGAQLGGQTLLRTLGPRLVRPTRWLEGYGPETGARWRAFLAAVEAHLTTRADAEVAAENARATFAWIDEWFTLRGVAGT
jgi:heme oxygenase